MIMVVVAVPTTSISSAEALQVGSLPCNFFLWKGIELVGESFIFQ